MPSGGAMKREGLRKRKTVYPTKPRKKLSVLARKSVVNGLKRPNKGRVKKVSIKNNKQSVSSTATTLSPSSSFERKYKKSKQNAENHDDGIEDDGSVFPYGILYVERLKSFLKNKWPFTKHRARCDPHSLAMAGFLFQSKEPSLSAKCFACFHTIHDLSADSHPWLLHEKVNPNCILIKLGRIEKPDDYTMEQVLDICKYLHFDFLVHILMEAALNKLDEATQYCEAYLMRSLKILADSENVSDVGAEEKIEKGDDSPASDSTSEDDDEYMNYEEQPSFTC